MNAIRKHRHSATNQLSSDQQVGTVYLVGAGPGAADLLSIRALNALTSADVVYYDSLVSEEVLTHIPDHVRKVFVGKRKGSKAMEQHTIEAHLIDEASSGRHVVRLKGGDPFIFGRGGEELFHLRAEGIPVEVIPGITAAGAAAGAFDIPLTYRDVSTSVTFATGHAHDGTTAPLNGGAVAKGTLVIYMGISNAHEIAADLMTQGVPGTTAVAIIERASSPEQRRVNSSLESLVTDIAANQIAAPALLIIGEVASLKDTDIPLLKTSRQAESKDSFAWVHHPMG